MHYEIASAELITFVNGCFIMTGKGGSGDHGKLSSSDERFFYGNDRHYFAGRQ